MMHPKRLVAGTAIAVALLLAGCGGQDEQRGFAPPPKEVSKAEAGSTEFDGPFKATLVAPGHLAKVGKPWRWKVEVTTNDGEPLAASAQIQFVFAGQVVGRGSRARFVGIHRSAVKWPERSVGYPLTFRVALTTDKGKANLDYPVQVEGGRR